MPANLNALIRYKTINSCLSGGRRKWSIDELTEACSEALADSRGRYNALSERTIRDDIRVMRSDILGFNAPIKQQKGLYFYSDPHYSIMGISLTDSNIVAQVIRVLNEIKSKVNHPELEIILKRLTDLQLQCVPVHESFSLSELQEIKSPSVRKMRGLRDSLHKIRLEEPQGKISFNTLSDPDMRKDLTWGELLKVIFS